VEVDWKYEYVIAGSNKTLTTRSEGNNKTSLRVGYKIFLEDHRKLAL